MFKGKLSLVRDSKYGIFFIWTMLLVLLFTSFVFSLSAGAFSLNWLNILTGKAEFQEKAVLFAIRLPRTLLGAIVGAGLAVSGAALQGVFRNPLADPGLIGITAGAALAAAFSIVILGPLPGFWRIYTLSFAAFTGGLLTGFLVFRLAKNASNSQFVTHLLLAGIAINAIAAAGTGLLSFLSNDQQLRSLVFWTMGGLAGSLWSQLIVSAILIVPLIFMIMREGCLLNIVMLGDDQAKMLGVETQKLKQRILFFVALTIGLCVAVSGVIGFVGLVVPHIVRFILGPDHRILIPVSACFGAILLSFADTFARIIVMPTELPVGLITSLIGGPFFIWLLIQYRFKGNRYD